MGEQERISTYRTGARESDGGFTVLELLLVLALLSLVSAAISVGIPNVGDRYAVERNASLVERELSKAAEVATRSGYDEIVVIEKDEHATRLLTSSGMVEMEPSIRFNWVAAGEAGTGRSDAGIVFFGAGGSSGGIIELERGTVRVRIQIDWLTGSVRRKK